MVGDQHFGDSLLLPQLCLDLALLVEVAVHRDSASSVLSVALSPFPARDPLIKFLILGRCQSPSPQHFSPNSLPSHPSQPTAKERIFCWCCKGGGPCSTCHVRIIPAPWPSYLHNAVLVKCCPVQDTLDAAPGIIDIKKVPPVIAVLFDLRVIGLPKQ